MAEYAQDGYEPAMCAATCVGCLSQADIVFWLGDLNYRITEEIADQEVFDMLGRGDLETLRRVLFVFMFVLAFAGCAYDRRAAVRVSMQ